MAAVCCGTLLQGKKTQEENTEDFCFFILREIGIVLVAPNTTKQVVYMLRRCLRRLAAMDTPHGHLSPSAGLPKRMILVRHAECDGNIDENVYLRTPDWRIDLTEAGKRQADDAAARLHQLVRRDPLCVYYSPYVRARRTWEIMRGRLRDFDTNILSEREDPRLREQDMGNFQAGLEQMNRAWTERDDFGRFFYRFANGESGADACDRASSFIDSYFRERQTVAYPDDTTVVIVTHGLMIRLFVKRWFHLSVETFEQMRNPPNCGFVVFERYESSGRRRMRMNAEARTMLHVPDTITLTGRYVTHPTVEAAPYGAGLVLPAGARPAAVGSNGEVVTRGISSPLPHTPSRSAHAGPPDAVN
jgi:broad specificity phosphatase PhoE